MSNLCKRCFCSRFYDRCRSLFVVRGVIEAFLHRTAVFLFQLPIPLERRVRRKFPSVAVPCRALLFHIQSPVGDAPAGRITDRSAVPMVSEAPIRERTPRRGSG